jgi:hypothetical protein
LRVRALRWSQKRRCGHNVYYLSFLEIAQTVNFIAANGRLSAVDPLAIWALTLASFSDDPFPDVCWAILELNVVGFTSLQKSDSVLIHQS